MKKFLTAIVALCFAAPSFAQYSSGGFSLSESSLYYGLRLGMNISTITGDYTEDADSKVGMNLAGVVGVRVSDSTPIFLESGLYFSNRGAKDLSLKYLEIPILIKYGIQMTDDIALLPYIGPYFSYGMGGKYKTVHVDKETGMPTNTFDKRSSYKRIKHPDMGFKVGCGLDFNKLYAELGYQFGVANIAKDNPEDLGAHTGNLYVNIGINF